MNIDEEIKKLEAQLTDLRARKTVADNDLVVWRVEITGTLFVLAPNPNAACACARYWVQEEPSVRYRAQRITEKKQVPRAWRKAVPYEGTTSYLEELASKTIEEHLS